MCENVIVEVEQEVTLETISEEIKKIFKMENQSVFEIGKRLLHVKTEDLAHGQFAEWVGSIGIDKHEASKYIKVQKRLSKLDICSSLTKRILFELLPIENVEEFVNQEHTIPSTGEVKMIDSMTVAELKEVKRGDREPKQNNNYISTVGQRLKNLIKPLSQMMNDENLSVMVVIGGLTKEQQTEWLPTLSDMISTMKTTSKVMEFIDEQCNEIQRTNNSTTNASNLIDLFEHEELSESLESQEWMAV